MITAAGVQNVSASNPLSADSMLMQVCAGDKADCACLSWKQIGKKVCCCYATVPVPAPCPAYVPSCLLLTLCWPAPKGPQYCEIPADGGPPGPVLNTTAHPGRMDRWQGVPVRVTGSNTVTVDLSSVNASTGAVSAIKFGWGWSNMDCCTSPETAAGLAPCIPGSCGIMSAKSLLPVNPFFATLSAAGKCSYSRIPAVHSLSNLRSSSRKYIRQVQVPGAAGVRRVDD